MVSKDWGCGLQTTDSILWVPEFDPPNPFVEDVWNLPLLTFEPLITECQSIGLHIAPNHPKSAK
jgi:hypothetical protein